MRKGKSENNPIYRFQPPEDPGKKFLTKNKLRKYPLNSFTERKGRDLHVYMSGIGWINWMDLEKYFLLDINEYK